MISRLFLPVFLVSGHCALAHEFWIEPQQYQVETGNSLIADLKNGQEFEGVDLGWFDNNFSRFEIAIGDQLTDVPGRPGDYPAMNMNIPGEGLAVVLHETTPATLTYTEWDKFISFAEHKDFRDAASDHVANGWSQEKFKEQYTRHVKALIAVGNGEGSDRAFGLATEIVALTNPYMLAAGQDMQVSVFYGDAPRADAQVEVFDRGPDGAVSITLTRTDAAGQARIPVTPGHEYLLDAVVLRPSAQAGTSPEAPVWETLWAALTFSVPK